MGNEATQEAEAILQKLRDIYAPEDEHPIHRRVGAFFWGARDEEVAFLMGLCRMAADEPIAQLLYYWHCGEDMCGGPPASSKVSAWACGVAAEFAMTRGRRGRKRLDSYRLDWGRQAAHDGVCLALFGDRVRDLMPGVNKRAERFKCRNEAYQRVRDHVQGEAKALVDDFRCDMERAADGKFSPDFRGRYEQNTGMPFPS